MINYVLLGFSLTKFNSKDNYLLQDLIQINLCNLQEEYVVGDEIGRLQCSHKYHVDCVQEWLKLKNWCPMCKESATLSNSSSSSSSSSHQLHFYLPSVQKHAFSFLCTKFFQLVYMQLTNGVLNRALTDPGGILFLSVTKTCIHFDHQSGIVG